MLTSCTKKYNDESNEQTFRFTFYCDRCGKPYQSAALKFTGADTTDTECEKELWELRWQKEHSQSFDRANHEAAYHFFRCPGCGEYVCDDCTVTEKLPTGEVRDLCCRCNGREGSRRKSVPMKMVHPEVPPGKSKKKGWFGLWRNKDSRRSPNE